MTRTTENALRLWFRWTASNMAMVCQCGCHPPYRAACVVIAHSTMVSVASRHSPMHSINLLRATHTHAFGCLMLPVRIYVVRSRTCFQQRPEFTEHTHSVSICTSISPWIAWFFTQSSLLLHSVHIQIQSISNARHQFLLLFHKWLCVYIAIIVETMN